jgi:hypothetical protein
MSTLLVEESLVARLSPSVRSRLAVVPRRRGRAGWAPLAPDEVVDALVDAGEGATILARGVVDDPGAASLGALGRIMGREVVRLPADPELAERLVAVAASSHDDGAAELRRLQALGGAAGIRLPAVRPRVLARWAGLAWRPCVHCRGGGLAGAGCGRCGAPLAVAP